MSALWSGMYYIHVPDAKDHFIGLVPIPLWMMMVVTIMTIIIDDAIVVVISITD